LICGGEYIDTVDECPDCELPLVDERPDQELSDVVLSLKAQELPCYFSVHKRFTRTPEEYGQGGSWVDFTKKKISDLKDTAHALMLEAFEPDGETDGKVYFKDPNFGDVHFFVTVAQFRAMATGHPIRMRPFFAAGKQISALAKVIVA